MRKLAMGVAFLGRLLRCVGQTAQERRPPRREFFADLKIFVWNRAARAYYS
jgi:hypothetical protein